MTLYVLFIIDRNLILYQRTEPLRCGLSHIVTMMIIIIIKTTTVIINACNVRRKWVPVVVAWWTCRRRKSATGPWPVWTRSTAKVRRIPLLWESVDRPDWGLRNLYGHKFVIISKSGLNKKKKIKKRIDRCERCELRRPCDIVREVSELKAKKIESQSIIIYRQFEDYEKKKNATWSLFFSICLRGNRRPRHTLVETSRDSRQERRMRHFFKRFIIRFSETNAHRLPGTLFANSTTLCTVGVMCAANCCHNHIFCCSSPSAVEDATSGLEQPCAGWKQMKKKKN